MNDWSHARSILCVRLDAMGDLLMTTPAMRALKEGRPDRRLTLLTSSQGAAMAESIPLFDEVITYPAPWLKASGDRQDPAMDFRMIEQLRERNFDAAVIFTVYSQNPLPAALLCYLSGIPLRAAHCRENPYGLLTNWIRESEPGERVRHEVRRQLDLVGELGALAKNAPLVLAKDAVAEESVKLKLLRHQVDPEIRDWVLIHPGSTAASRRYDPHHFSQVADLLIHREGRKVIFTGGLEERDLIAVIQSEMKGSAVNLAGELTLKEMVALIALSPLLISNNSGPVHMAAARGTPVVVLYALTNPQHTPWMVPSSVLFHQVDCGFCYKSLCPEGTNACLSKVTPELVVERARDFFHRQKGPVYDEARVEPLYVQGSKL